MPPLTIHQRLRHEHGLARASFSITITEDFMQHHRIAHRKILLLDPRSNLLQFQIIELVVPDALASYRGAPCAAYHAEVQDHRDAHPAQLRTASDMSRRWASMSIQPFTEHDINSQPSAGSVWANQLANKGTGRSVFRQRSGEPGSFGNSLVKVVRYISGGLGILVSLTDNVGLSLDGSYTCFFDSPPIMGFAPALSVVIRF
jgi:hypothetical protein